MRRKFAKILTSVAWICYSVDAGHVSSNDEMIEYDLKNIFSARSTDGDGDDGDNSGGRSGDGDIVTERKTRTKSKTAKPPLFKVILLNDDYTPMEFVVEVLKAVFHKQHAEATRIMLH